MQYEIDNSIFRTFVPTNGKRPIVKIKGKSDISSFDDVKNLESYNGILKDEYVCIDVDSEAESKKLLNIIVDNNIKCEVRKTTRGMHFYFLNDEESITTNKTVQMTPLGITVDVRLGKRNGMCCLKKDGKVREVLYRTDEFEKIPYFIKPIGSRSKYDFNILGLGDGEGRNDVLFKYIIYLCRAGLTERQIKDLYKNFINRYMFNTPLSDEELESITRAEAFVEKKETFYTNDETPKFQHNVFGKYLIEKHNIKYLNQQLYYYKDNHYVPLKDDIRKLMFNEIDNLKKNQCAEVENYIENQSSIFNHELADPKFISFKNCILDIETFEQYDHSPEFNIINQIDWNYNPLAYNETLDNVLNNIACNDQSTRLLLEEMIGYCMYRRNELRKSFALVGGGMNGKSTLINYMTSLLGDNNISHLSLADLEERFRLAEIEGKLANLGDDVSSTYIKDTSYFKKVVSGDYVTAEHKHGKIFSIKSYAKFVFSFNKLPTVNDDSDAFISRLIVVPLKARFNKENKNYNPFIASELKSQSAMEYGISIAINALRGVLANKSFTINETIENEIKEYERVNNPIYDFIDELKSKPNGANITNDIDLFVNNETSFIYDCYVDFCARAGYKASSRRMFMSRLKLIFPNLGAKQIRKENNSRCYIFEKTN